MKSNQLPRVRHTEQRGINAILLFNPCRHCCFGKMYPTGRIGLSVCCHLPSNASPSRLPHGRKHSVPRERDKVVRTGCINRIRSWWVKKGGEGKTGVLQLSFIALTHGDSDSKWGLQNEPRESNLKDLFSASLFVGQQMLLIFSIY